MGFGGFYVVVFGWSFLSENYFSKGDLDSNNFCHKNYLDSTVYKEIYYVDVGGLFSQPAKLNFCFTKKNQKKKESTFMYQCSSV